MSFSILLDNDAIDAMKVAADITPSIRGSMERLVGDIVSAKFDVSEALINVKALSKRLRDNIRTVQESDLTADTKALRDEATTFTKICLSPCFNTDLRTANLVFGFCATSAHQMVILLLMSSRMMEPKDHCRPTYERK